MEIRTATVTSQNGIRIAYDKLGHEPVGIEVSGSPVFMVLLVRTGACQTACPSS